MEKAGMDIERPTTKRSVIAAACFILILFISSFDAIGVNGLVPRIQENFQLTDAETALFRTASSVAHSVALGVIWMFGDQFERRNLFIASTAFWVLFSLSSVLIGSNSFMTFVACRSLGAAASAVFSVLAPVILADMFKESALGVVLMLMGAGGVISGMVTGIVSSWIVSNDLPWQSSLIIGPTLTIVPLIALICLRKSLRCAELCDKQRGISRVLTSAFGLFSNKSYLLMTATASFGLLHLKAYMFWFPAMYLSAWSSFPDVFLGLSYTMVTSLNSIAMLIGTLIGLPTILFLAQSWRLGTGPFSSRKEYARAYPLVVCIGASLNVVMTMVNILLIDKNYATFLVVTFLMSIGAGADLCLSQMMMLMVVPTSSRAAAVALSQLVSGVVSIPSAQLVGMVSDAFRGDSALVNDRFHAYQMALLCSSSFLVASAICSSALVLFFPRDCQRAEESDQDEEQSMSEKTPLIESTKLRSESLIDNLGRSRTATVNSIYNVVS